MSSIKRYVLCVTVATCMSCAGTIDDPSIYENYQGAANSEPRIMPSWDAGSATNRDTTNTTPAKSDAGNAGRDTSPPPAPIDAGTSDAGSTSAACDFKGLMKTKCGSAACHGAPGISTGLDLVSDGLAARVGSKKATGACSDYLLIDQANPERSALYLLVTNQSCGVRMPLGATLSDAEQSCILQWIQKL